MLLSEISGAVILDVPANAEVSHQVMPGQVVAKTLTAGEIEVGLSRNRLTRFGYSTGGVIVCRSNAEEWVRWRNPMSMLLVPIPQHALSIAAEESGAINDVVATPDLRDPRVFALLTAIQAEIETGFKAGSLFIESTFLALAAALLQANGAVRKLPSKSGLTPRQLSRIQEFMRVNLERDVHLAELASILELSPGHFGQMFRRATGVSPHHYLLQLRLQRARQLLALDSTGILDIAVACGFKTQQHFATAFRTRYGVTPSAYQRRSCG
jgi:AraC family transcriptional regulator